MLSILHLDCGLLETAHGRACCHCLALVEAGRVALVDAGIGLLDCRRPDDRLGRELIDAAGFRFDESRTAIRRLEERGFLPDQVEDVVLTHADPDHTGGLADFPHATVHVSSEERAALAAGEARYQASHFDHAPRWMEHAPTGDSWQGLPARRVTVCGGAQVFLVELFGHTAGHCGVAIPQGNDWLLHAGDAYYLRAELDDPAHPVGELAAIRAHDNTRRLASLDALRRLRADLGPSLRMTGYHDVAEWGLFGGS